MGSQVTCCFPENYALFCKQQTQDMMIAMANAPETILLILKTLHDPSISYFSRFEVRYLYNPI